MGSRRGGGAGAERGGPGGTDPQGGEAGVDAGPQHVEVGHVGGIGSDADVERSVVGEDRDADGEVAPEGDHRKGLQQARATAVERDARPRHVGNDHVHQPLGLGELAEAVETLSNQYQELKSAARERLGRLFNSADYPASLVGLFEVSYDFPSVEPPDYLRQLSPQLYAQEAARVTARFEETVQLAEQAFTEELSKLVSHLTERLSGGEDGKPKVFRDSAVENLQEFFQRFRHLNVRSSEQLDELVNRAQQVVRGVQPQQLREDQPLRQQVASQLAGVQSVLDGLLVDRPRRSILRRPQ